MFKTNILEGQKGIITGGSSGIGLELARYFMEHGAQVTITGRNKEKMDIALKELGEGAQGVIGDVRRSEEVAANYKVHMERFGRVDFLINNAAGNFLCPLENMSENAFRAVTDIVCLGTFLWSKSVQPQMKQQKYGRIINIGTVYADSGPATWVGHSGAGKSAVYSLTKTMAVEWGPQGILTNMIAPGVVEDTEGLKRLAGGLSEKISSLYPVKRMAKKWEVAALATFLLSPLAAYINGVIIPVDGGSHLAIPGLGIPPGINPLQP